MPVRRCLRLFYALTLAGATGAAAATIDLPATADGTLYEDATGALSNGAGQYFFAGRTDDGSIRRAVLRFDLSALPAGSTVTSVELKLTMSRTQGGAATVALHRLSGDWGEGTSDANGEEGRGAASTPNDVTWIHRVFATAPWITAGGDFTATPSASTSVIDVGPYTWASTPALVADVQSWLDGSTPNHGFLLLGNEAVATTAKRFDSRSHATVANRPRLTVTYSPPPLGACCDVNGDCLEIAPGACAGSYQGDGTTCGAGGKCGACCDAVSCAYKVDATCTQYRGDGTSCVPDPCAAPILGACCYGDSTCAEVEATACSGSYQGNGTTCDAGLTCGGCCDGATCALTVAGTCAGTYQGAGSACSPNPCAVASVGACCTGTTCVDGTSTSACALLGGEYQGDDQTCATNPCDAESRACCFAGERCVVMNRDECDAMGGDRQGGGSTCSNRPCAAIGSCCLGTSCVPDSNHDDCENLGGEYQGGIPCGLTTCGEAVACCLPGAGGCALLAELECDARGGEHLPVGVTCTPDPCAGAACDAALIQPILRLMAVKSSSRADVSLTWTADPRASGYNTWFVTTKDEVPVATSLGPATGVSGCRDRATADCNHASAVAEAIGSRLFYNVLGACNGTEAAR